MSPLAVRDHVPEGPAGWEAEDKELAAGALQLESGPCARPSRRRVEVAGSKLSLPDKGHCLLVCKEAYPDGDLVLLVTVRTRPFAGATTERAAAGD